MLKTFSHQKPAQTAAKNPDQYHRFGHCLFRCHSIFSTSVLSDMHPLNTNTPEKKYIFKTKILHNSKYALYLPVENTEKSFDDGVG
jgi:hypothetical protein